MKSLKTLIQLQQRQLDDQRKILNQLEQEGERLALLIKQLKDELAAEAKLASEQPEMARYYGGFAQGNEVQQKNIRQQQAKLSKLTEHQREVIRAAFAELKKLEIAQENALKIAKAKVDKAENAELDEIGLRKQQ